MPRGLCSTFWSLSCRFKASITLVEASSKVSLCFEANRSFPGIVNLISHNLLFRVSDFSNLNSTWPSIIVGWSWSSFRNLFVIKLRIFFVALKPGVCMVIFIGKLHLKSRNVFVSMFIIIYVEATDSCFPNSSNAIFSSAMKVSFSHWRISCSRSVTCSRFNSTARASAAR